jgi:hypothetical protein
VAIAKVPPEVVVKPVPTLIMALAVSVPPVLLKIKVL